MNHTLTTPDGISLALRTWVPAGSPRGQVLVVHGLGEHMGRYEALAQDLAAQGWAVQAYDQRGHGASGGGRGQMAADESLLADLGQVLQHVRSAPSCGPLILLGHSMGGLVAARYVAEGLQARPAPWWQAVDGLVLSSPALDAGMTVIQKLLTAVVSRVAPNLAVGNGLNLDDICRDPAVVKDYAADPLVHDRISGRLARFIAEAGPWVEARAAQWRTPTLLMWAGADRCVNPAGSARFAAAAPQQVLTAQTWPMLAHEIFNEPERADVVARLQAWLGSRLNA
ncbi:alpha/beta hydrolase [Ideonella paludis]|uniref:Lysophospholipase n=1 Tax=Ideonella paludis TaxID=1233411 RepID=A0ABS5E2Y2_9BURK|nr:alpha/beta hydrolase [Ideonella paludis]MBQ0937726.1 lysophospholipase [Ideonella paludis]